MKSTKILKAYSFSVCIQVISKYLRLDKGTETGHTATIHAFLRQDQDNEPETVFYGPSTNNKVFYHLSGINIINKIKITGLMHM